MAQLPPPLLTVATLRQFSLAMVEFEHAMQSLGAALRRLNDAFGQVDDDAARGDWWKRGGSPPTYNPHAIDEPWADSELGDADEDDWWKRGEPPPDYDGL